MAEYIDKEIAIKTVIDSFSCYFPNVTDAVRKIPAADVQPIRRGQWKLTNNPSFRKCSECDAWWSSDITDNCFTNYCPKCGARMDGDTNG